MTIGDLKLLVRIDLNKISKKILLGSPGTIIIGLFFTYVVINFCFIKKDF